MTRVRILQLMAIPLMLIAASGCGKKGDSQTSGTEPPAKKLSPDDQKCMALATKSNACKKPSRKGHNRILMRSCQRDIAKKEIRALQIKMTDCAAESDCTAFDACYEKTAKPLRDHYFKLHLRKRGRRVP